MLSERTTTTGDSLPVTQIKAFHMIKEDVTIIPIRQQTEIRVSNGCLDGHFLFQDTDSINSNKNMPKI